MNKKLLSICLVLTMLASMLSFVSVFAADNVIYAYSFESEGEGWSYYGKDPNSNLLSTAKAKVGKSSLYVNDTSDSGTGGITGGLAKVIVGETYTATAEVFNEVDGSVFILRFVGDDKKTKVSDKQVRPTKKGEWETLTATLKAPEGAVYVRVLVATMSATLGTAYYDDIKLMGKAAEEVKQPAASTTTAPSTSTETTTEVKVDANGTKYTHEIQFLAKLGLIGSDFKYDALITKAEMAKMIAIALHPDVDFTITNATDALFNDVPASHAYYSYIKACRDLGVVKGDYDNNFYPDAQITAIEAMTMVINALGYTPYAQAYGGYPTGYYSVASETGISKGLNIASTEPIKFEVAAKIIYNALFADIVQLNGVKNDSIELTINNGKNILSERLGIYEYNAIVVDNGVTSITGSSIGNDERAVIEEVSTGDRITAFINGTDIAQYLGYRVKAFIKNNIEEGRYEYIYVAPAKNSVVTVNARYIFNANNSYVEYDEDETTLGSEKLNFGSVKPRIIYNGVKKVNSVAENIPADGFVTFIENTGDANYDLINILSFNETRSGNAWDIIVDTVNTKEGEHSISCMFDPSKTIDLNDEEYSYAFAMSSEIKSISDIKQGDVISVAKAPELIDGKTHYILVPSRNKTDSVLSGIGDNEFILENGDEYAISSSALGTKPNYVRYFELGKKITVWVDITGKVAYAEGESGNSKNYAYMLVAKARPDANEKSTVVKMFTKDGKMEQAKLSSKCKIDGRQYDSADLQVAALNKRSSVTSKIAGDETTGRPIIYDMNSEGLITRIDTDNPNVSLGYVDGSSVENATPVTASVFYANQQVIPYSIEDADSFDTLKAGFRNYGSSTFYDNSNRSIEGKFLITANTVVINAAEIDTYGYYKDLYKAYSVAGSVEEDYHKFPGHSIDVLKSLSGTDDDYKVQKGSEVTRSVKYDIQGYDIDPDTGVAGLAVIRGLSKSAIATNADMLIYTRRTTVYDTNKEQTVTKLYFFDKTGKEVSVLYDRDTLLSEYVDLIDNKIKQGDVVRYTADANGYITSMDRMITFDNLISRNQYTSLEVTDADSGIDNTTTYHLAYSNNTVTTGYAYAVKGGTVDIIGGTQGVKLSDLYDSFESLSPNNRYFLECSKIKPIIVTVEGSDIRVEEGTLDDIIGVKDVTDHNGNIDKDKASILVIRQSRFVPNYLIVYNGLDTYVSH